ncbi:MAG TPA: sialidase family protein [Steroidobacteraceae bacterium]|nr:sialidase family protein [Steroidobacteraceae bacterium]
MATPVETVNSSFPDGCPIEAPDGLSLFFASARPEVPGNIGNDIWVADRESLTSPWQPPKNLGAPVNSLANDFCPTPVYGRSLFFVSERSDNGTVDGPCGGGDIYLSRQSPAGGWSPPVMLDCAPKGPNFKGQERSPSLVETWFGTFLFYSSNGDDGGDQDIYMSRLGPDGKFGPGRVVQELSTPTEDIMPNVRQRDDGAFEIVFSSDRPTWGNGQPAMGKQDVYISYTLWPTARWSQPRNLGGAVNTGGIEQRSTLSADGKRLYFGRDGDIYVSQRSGRH